MLANVPQSSSVTQDDVIAEEKRQINDQRREQGLDQIGATPQSGLVGVSLSGGGVRSGAVSLGFLMGLAHFGILRWVDYLSTVSGGGYAGATLSAERKTYKSKVDSDQNQSSSALASRIFAEAGQDNSSTQQSALVRIRELIFQCNYLFRQRGWMSRAMLGVTVMGTVILSTTIAVTSFFAWLFRSLYEPPVLDFLKAMGFEGDLIVPMTPAITTFFLWFICWLLSFVRHNRHATGNTASVVFSIFLLCTVLGVTMIAVTGDIDVEHLRNKTGTTKEFWEEWGTLGVWVKSGILAIIGASLLPYFRPAALLRSGRERTAGPKKILFVLARNGLLFGIPLLFFGYVAHEDFSGINVHRDYRLEFKDLLSADDGFEHGPHQKLFSEFEIALSERGPKPWPAAELAIRKSLAQYFWTKAIQEEWSYYNACNREYALLSAGTFREGETQQNAILNSNNEQSRLSRLVEFLQYCGAKATGTSSSTRLGRMLHWLHEARNSSRRLIYLFNCRMINPCVYRGIPLPTSRPIGLRFWEKPPADSDYITQVKQVHSRLEAFYNLPIQGNLPEPDQLRGTRIPDLSAMSKFRSYQWKVFKAQDEKYGDPSESLPSRTTGEQFSGIQSLPASMQDLFGDAPKTADARKTDNNLIVPPELSKGDLESLRSTVLRLNHELLRAAFPNTLRPRDSSAEVFSAIVLPADQKLRWRVFVTALCIALVSSALCDLNAFSWHGFYARQLGEFWVRAGYPKHTKLTLESLSSARPIHLINSSVCLPGKATTTEGTSREKTAHFLLSRLHCGTSLPGVGFVRTENSAFAELQLADAIALSGAALSPWATSNPLVKVLLLVMNLRTGLWLPHPSEAASPSQEDSGKGKLFNALRNFFSPLKWVSLSLLPIQLWPPKRRPAESWPRLLITDGGHFENLGLESLLNRRCKLIIAVDASEDPNFEFEGLSIVMNRVRTRDGIRFLNPQTQEPAEFPRKLIPGTKSGLSKKRFAAFTIVYPEANPADTGAPNSTGLLIFVKSVLLKNDPLELHQHRKEFPAFPNDPTSDQAFSPEKFEAYRFLGFTAASQLAEQLGIRPDDPPKSLVAHAEIHFAKARRPLPPSKIIDTLENLHNNLSEGLDGNSPPDVREAFLKDARERLADLKNLTKLPKDTHRKLFKSIERHRELLQKALDRLDVNDPICVRYLSEQIGTINNLIQLLTQHAAETSASLKHSESAGKKISSKGKKTP